ncbi:MAG TPA: hypothetical protein VJ302_01425 [Blastocatellia bacterium]|nr:hypothetical protein [Blastocatellia bacterium]
MKIVVVGGSGLIGSQLVAESMADGDTIRIPPAYIQPVWSADVAIALAGLDLFGFDDWLRRSTTAK